MRRKPTKKPGADVPPPAPPPLELATLAEEKAAAFFSDLQQRLWEHLDLEFGPCRFAPRDFIAALAVRLADDLCYWLRAQPAEVLRETASVRAEWPVISGRHPDIAAAAARELERIGQGEGAWTKQVGRKVPSRTKLVNKVALHWLGRLNARRWVLREFPYAIDTENEVRDREIASLPDYKPGHARKWAAVAWKGILDETNGHPEAVPELCALGQHRTEHSQHRAQQKKATSATKKANVVDGIREAFALAFVRLARKPTIAGES